MLPVFSPEADWPHALVAAIRRRGVTVPTSSMIHFVEAAAVVGVGQRNPLYWAARATLTTSRHQVAALDAAFAEVIDGAVLPAWIEVADPTDVVVPDGADNSTPDLRSVADAVSASWAERLHGVDPDALASLEDLDRCAAVALVEQLRSRPEFRRSARRRRSNRDSDELDLRRTLAAAVAEGGETFRPRTRAPSQRPRRILVVLDVSGSMRPFVSVGLRFAHAVVHGLGLTRTEVVGVGTQATRLGRILSEGIPERACANAIDAVDDMGGGTRLADGLAWLLGSDGALAAARGAVVIIHSDGWDAADPVMLGRSLDRLARLAHRVVWANPLVATPGFTPSTRALVAALPHLALHGPGHSVAAMASVLFSDSDLADGPLKGIA